MAKRGGLLELGMVGGVVALLLMALGRSGWSFGGSSGSAGRSGRVILWLRGGGLFDAAGTRIGVMPQAIDRAVGNAAEVELHITGAATQGNVTSLTDYLKNKGITVYQEFTSDGEASQKSSASE